MMPGDNYVTFREFERETNNLKDRVDDVKDDIKEIKDNHLKHIKEDLTGMRKMLYDMRIKFEKVNVKQTMFIAIVVGVISIGVPILLKVLGI